jgi:hypothetical protein
VSSSGSGTLADEVIERNFWNAVIEGCDLTLWLISCRAGRWLARQLCPDSGLEGLKTGAA